MSDATFAFQFSKVADPYPLAQDFANLVLLSASSAFETLYGPSAVDILKHSFCRRRTLFSHEHVTLAQVDSLPAGMLLGYDWRVRRAQQWQTGLMKQLSQAGHT